MHSLSDLPSPRLPGTLLILFIMSLDPWVRRVFSSSSLCLVCSAKPRLWTSPSRVLLYLLFQANQKYQQPGTHFLLSFLAWDSFRLLGSINSNLNVWETQTVSFYFPGEDFSLWAHAETDMISCSLAEPADRFFPDLCFPWGCNPWRMPTASGGGEGCLILTPSLMWPKVSFPAPCGHESPALCDWNWQHGAHAPALTLAAPTRAPNSVSWAGAGCSSNPP